MDVQLFAFLAAVAMVSTVPLDGEKGETGSLAVGSDIDMAESRHKGHYKVHKAKVYVPKYHAPKYYVPKAPKIKYVKAKGHHHDYAHGY